MATVKSFTSLEQAKKLAEILPLESADMCWQYQKDRWVGEPDYNVFPQFEHTTDKRDIPCWSLSALLGVLPLVEFTTPQLIGTPKTLYRCMYNDDLKSHAYDNPVDACYEMILKLKEKNLL